MIKFLFCLLAAGVAWFWWRNQAARASGAAQTDTPPAQTPSQPMLACAYCNLHFPKDEAVYDGAEVFCSLEHRRAHFAERL